MKRVRIISLAVLALFALGALVTCSTYAVEGLLPGGLAFTVLAGKTKLEAGKEAVSCGETKGNGKLEGNHDHGTVTFDFLRCEFVGFPVFSLGEKEPKEVKEALILSTGLFLLCLVEPKKLVFGIYMEMSPTIHLHIKALGVLLNVKGSLIGEITTPAELEGKLFDVSIEGKEGKPAVKECHDEAGNVKTAKLESEKDPSAAVEANLKSEEALAEFTESTALMDH